jgi:hypothetical protein
MSDVICPHCGGVFTPVPPDPHYRKKAEARMALEDRAYARMRSRPGMSYQQAIAEEEQEEAAAAKRAQYDPPGFQRTERTLWSESEKLYEIDQRYTQYALQAAALYHRLRAV